MVDKGPLLTSAIIFYLSIGAAIFQVLEEPNWKRATQDYKVEKGKILLAYPCLSEDDLDKILEVWSHIYFTRFQNLCCMCFEVVFYVLNEYKLTLNKR